jgi:integrase
MGLGPYPTVSLAAARKRAEECRRLVIEGLDPLASRDRAAEPTFAEAAADFIATQSPGWRNAKHRYQWEQTLGAAYCAPILDKRVREIGLEDVLAILQPVWQKRPETASRLRGRIERVLDAARVKGWRSGENPARWRGNLDSLLPKRRKRETVKHHPAMAYDDVPGFVERLRHSDSVGAKALEFLILTAARSGEVLGAVWSEFDLEAGLWTIPAARMKAKKEHRVPLSARALEIVKHLSEAQLGNLVFPGMKPGKPLSDMTLTAIMRRMDVGAVPHGFRSSFRDWAGDRTAFDRETVELALAHEIGNSVERAYRRRDALEKRNALMTAWAEHCDRQEAGNVVLLRKDR